MGFRVALKYGKGNTPENAGDERDTGWILGWGDP